MQFLLTLLIFLAGVNTFADILSESKLTRFAGSLCDSSSNETTSAPLQKQCVDIYIDDINAAVYALMVKTPNERRLEINQIELMKFKPEEKTENPKLIEFIKGSPLFGSEIKKSYDFLIYK